MTIAHPKHLIACMTFLVNIAAGCAAEVGDEADEIDEPQLEAGETVVGVTSQFQKQLLTKAPKPTPDPPASGCRLTAQLYDSGTKMTTFWYDCDHAVDAAGHTGYAVKKPGDFSS